MGRRDMGATTKTLGSATEAKSVGRAMGAEAVGPEAKAVDPVMGAEVVALEAKAVGRAIVAAAVGPEAKAAGPAMEPELVGPGAKALGSTPVVEGAQASAVSCREREYGLLKVRSVLKSFELAIRC
jgi:hypothetical protein